MYTKIWTNRPSRSWVQNRFVRSRGTFFLGKSVKKKVLFSQNSTQYLTIDFFKNPINQNHQFTYSDQILGKFEHYWVQNVHFWAFFALFFLIFPFIINRRNECLASWQIIHLITFTVITFEPLLNQFSKCQAFWKDQIKGY